MSARTNIKTDLKDKEILKESLSKLNVKFTEHAASASVKDYYGHKVSDKIEIKLSEYAGFERDAEGVFKLVGDMHFESGLFRNGKQAVEKVSQVYQATQVALALEENPNFLIESNNIDEAVNAEEIVIVASMR